MMMKELSFRYVELRAFAMEGKEQVHLQSCFILGLQVRQGVDAFVLTKRFGFGRADTTLAGGGDVNGRPCTSTTTFLPNDTPRLSLSLSLTHSLTRSLAHPLTHSPTHPLTHTHTLNHSLTPSLPPSLTHSLSSLHFTSHHFTSLHFTSLTHARTHSLTHPPTHSLTHSPAHPLTH